MTDKEALITQLKPVFDAYAKGNSWMDSRTFAKLLKETKIIDKKFTTTNADLTFAKIKPRAEKGLSIDLVVDACAAIGASKGVTTEDIVRQMTSSSGPSYHGTVAEPTRFHDDKSSYTGVHAHGGPSTVDVSSRTPKGGSSLGSVKAVRLEDLCDRSAPDVRGRNK